MEASIGSTDITEIPCGGNFYLTPDGEIVFSYQPYEVASYAQGRNTDTHTRLHPLAISHPGSTQSAAMT